jgi:hypothetical protein
VSTADGGNRLSPNLPARTKPQRLARLARLRWMIELDYRQLKGELGLDHYEGRSYLGWYHHTALVTTAHAFLTLERQNPNRRRRASRSPKRSALFMPLFDCWSDHCHTCQRPIDLAELPLPHTHRLELAFAERRQEVRPQRRFVVDQRRRLVLAVLAAWAERGRPPVGWFTERTAEAWLQDLLVETRRGTLPGMARSGVTFADAAAEWLRFIRVTCSASTERGARSGTRPIFFWTCLPSRSRRNADRSAQASNRTPFSGHIGDIFRDHGRRYV